MIATARRDEQDTGPVRHVLDSPTADSVQFAPLSDTSDRVNPPPPPGLTFPDDTTPSSPVGKGKRGVAKAQKSNNLWISRLSDDIKGSWIIDSGLMVPSVLLPNLHASGAATMRENMSLCTQRGDIDADVELQGSHDSPKAISLSVRTDNGRIDLNLRRASNVIFKASVKTLNGALTANIPPNFQGAIRLTTLAGTSAVDLSPALRRHSTLVAGSSRRYVLFIGDNLGPEQSWDGMDELTLEATGKIKLSYMDEHETYDLLTGAGSELVRLAGRMLQLTKNTTEPIYKYLSASAQTDLAAGKNFLMRMSSKRVRSVSEPSLVDLKGDSGSSASLPTSSMLISTEEIGEESKTFIGPRACPLPKKLPHPYISATRPSVARTRLVKRNSQANLLSVTAVNTPIHPKRSLLTKRASAQFTASPKRGLVSFE